MLPSPVNDDSNSHLGEGSEPGAPASLQPIESYQAALDFLYSRINYERIGHAPYVASNYRLDRMRALLDEMGRPQDAYPIIHIAGTKGKGSTASSIAAGLTGCGYKVGLYTSPHLLKLEERIKIDGVSCSPEELIALTESARRAANALLAKSPDSGRPTFFELTTAMGFLHFAQANATAVVLEVGLGGRLDSTNVCNPKLTVITSISLDHQAQLGDTIGAIAGEKAGIIKPGVPVVCSALHRDAREVIERKAEQLNAPLFMLDRDFHVDWAPTYLTASETPAANVTFGSESPALTALGNTQWQIRSLGRHQSENLAGALAALSILSRDGWHLEYPKLKAAIAGEQPRGRLEVIGNSPVQVVDTAHNPASIVAGLAALEAHFPGKAKIGVLSTSRDKDHQAMIEQLLPACSHLIATEFQGNPRALPVDQLKSAALCVKSANGLATQILACQTPAEAWKLANELARANDLIYATGSFFLAAEVLDLVQGGPPDPNAIRSSSDQRAASDEVLSGARTPAQS